MAKSFNIRKTIDTEKRLFTSPQFRDIQESLARGGRVNAEELPLSMRDTLGLKPGQKFRLSKKGYKNFIADRESSPSDPTGWRQDGNATEEAIISLSKILSRENSRKKGVIVPIPLVDPTEAKINLENSQNNPQLYDPNTPLEIENLDRAGNPMKMSADRKTLVPVSPAARGAVIENPGEIDTDAVGTLLNQLNNLLRPVARKAASLTPTGGVGVGVADTITDIKEKQIADNPLSRLLSDLSKGAKKAIATSGGETAVTPEDRALEFLNKNILAQPFPEKKGVKKYAGIGTFKTPYGRFHIDESGTLRKL